MKHANVLQANESLYNPAAACEKGITETQQGMQQMGSKAYNIRIALLGIFAGLSILWLPGVFCRIVAGL